MTTKINKIFFHIATIALVSALLVGCAKEDNTGQSTLKPTNPTISVEAGFTSPASLVENDSVFEYTVTLSEAQLVDINLNVIQVGGTATPDDYGMSSSIYFAAGTTSGKGKIKILSDDVIEDTENLIIQVGDSQTANATFTPVTYEFNITSVTSGDITVEMTWETDAADAIGIDLAPTDVVDMRLLLTDEAGEVLGVIDGAGFEGFLFGGDNPDGTYIIAADIYATVNAGDFNAAVTLDINLAISQLGVISGMELSYPAVMTNEFPCEAYRTNLAKMVKSGSTYTITSEVSYIVPQAVEWFGTDTEFEYPSEVKTVGGCDLLISGLSYGWILDFWGETVIEEGLVVYTIADDGTINIPSQYAFTTEYDGAPYAYSISGTGVYDESGDYPTMVITYLLDQDGFNPSQYCFDNGLMTVPYFEANLTLDPDGKKSAKIGSSKFDFKKFKPVR